MDILLVGTYTQHDAPAVLEKQELGKGIYLIPYNETLGGVAGTPFIIQMQNPSWVCLVKNRLFAVSESEDAAEIVEYEVGVQEERLTAEKKAGLQMPGKASCHIEKDEKGQRLFVSDYGSGDLKVIDISEAGSPKLLQEISFTGKGLDPERQEASHIHSCFLHRGDLYAAAMLISGEFSQNVVAKMDNPPEIGYFALPVSNDAERNKAAVDVGIVYGVSTQTEHMDACKEVIDFLSDASLSDGYIAIVTEKPGSAPASQDFTVNYDSASTNDYLEYANSGNVIPWVYQQYVNGFDVISGDIFQGYMADAADKDEVISELDAAYLEYLDQ